MKRRDFLKTAGVAVGGAAPARAVSIVLEPGDAVASAGPAQWAAKPKFHLAVETISLIG
mgnify:CR=1 FL=1